MGRGEGAAQAQGAGEWRRVIGSGDWISGEAVIGVGGGGGGGGGGGALEFHLNRVLSTATPKALSSR